MDTTARADVPQAGEGTSIPAHHVIGGSPCQGVLYTPFGITSSVGRVCRNGLKTPIFACNISLGLDHAVDSFFPARRAAAGATRLLPHFTASLTAARLQQQRVVAAILAYHDDRRD